MPANNQSTISQTNTSDTPRHNQAQPGRGGGMRISRDKAAKQLGYSPFYSFMLSYQLKPNREEDVDEALAILCALWEYENQKQSVEALKGKWCLAAPIDQERFRSSWCAIVARAGMNVVLTRLQIGSKDVASSSLTISKPVTEI